MESRLCFALQIFSCLQSLSSTANFSAAKCFLGFVRRKLESDADEEEARAKNVSVVDIEAERMTRGGRRRRRSKPEKAAKGINFLHLITRWKMLHNNFCIKRSYFLIFLAPRGKS